MSDTEMTQETFESQAECAKHGSYTTRVIKFMGREIVTNRCPHCIAAEEREAEERQRAEQAYQHRQAVARMLDRSGIPRRFMDRTLDTYQAGGDGQRRALTIARRLVSADEGASAIFCGKPGTGKTHLACGVAHAFIESGRAARFGTVLSVLREIKDTYRRESERSESEVMADFMRPRLLVLDEVGVSLGSEHEKMLMFEIINERYQNQLSTLLLSNLNRAEITEYLGHRIMDRFAEGGAVVAFDWPSHRGNDANATK